MPAQTPFRPHVSPLAEFQLKAQKGIANRLFADATETDAALRLLGSEIAAECGCQPLFGPIKGRERAEQKVMADYQGDWYQLKDVARMTLVAPSRAHLEQVPAAITRRCRASTGMKLLKEGRTEGHASPVGFSGLNYVVQLRNERPAEMQAVLLEVYYGNMKESIFRSGLGGAAYHRLHTRFGIRGGLGHALYEVQRVAPASADGLLAQQLGRAYFGHLRGEKVLTHAGVRGLADQIAQFAKRHPTIFHH